VELGAGPQHPSAVARCCRAALLRGGDWRGPEGERKGGACGVVGRAAVPSSNIMFCPMIGPPGGSPLDRAAGVAGLACGCASRRRRGIKDGTGGRWCAGDRAPPFPSAGGALTTPPSPVSRRPLCLLSGGAPSPLRARTTPPARASVQQTVTVRRQRPPPPSPPARWRRWGGATPPLRGGARCGDEPPRVDGGSRVGATAAGPAAASGGQCRCGLRHAGGVWSFSARLSFGAPPPPPPPLAPLPWRPPHRVRRRRRGSSRPTTLPQCRMPGAAASCPRCTRPPAGGTRPP